MTPSIESNNKNPTTMQHNIMCNNDTVLASSGKNVCHGVNYELPFVDQFLDPNRRRRSSNATHSTEEPNLVDGTSTSEGDTMATTTIATNTTTTPTSNEEDAVPPNHTTQTTPMVPSDSTTNNNTNNLLSPNSARRVSTRDKQKKAAVTRTRVRYDLGLVPRVHRNTDYLQQLEQWYLKNNNNKTIAGDCACNNNNCPLTDSVVYIPKNRSEWEDSLSEMVAVCAQAATLRGKPLPLSRDYIRDRVDIDDPMHGYQIRHSTGGWLQGFMIFTNFTTWTHDFHWTAQHPESGMNGADGNGLSGELEREPRSGDPRAGGIVFSTLAEIALVGGLGCGEYLLRMALADIRSKGTYKYVVLQATDQSKAFYEKFGFVRVGAICRYGHADDPIVGYRHWTHANESKISLRKHGGPSYMMCLKLPESSTDQCMTCGKTVPARKILDDMMQNQVERKPTLEQLGSATTKIRRMSSMEGVYETGSGNSSPRPKNKVGRPPGRRKSHTGIGSATKARHTKGRAVSKVRATSATRSPGRPARTKRSFSDLQQESDQASKRLKEAPRTGELTYAQKQYHSVWLAVPPTKEAPSPRPPPKYRLAINKKNLLKFDGPVVKRKPGRPRKHPLPTEPAAAASVTKRKPGRPRKHPETAKRPVGRPKKSPGRPKKSVGRPRKSRLTVTKRSRTKKATTPSPNLKKGENGRMYHSIRGPDGKFVRVEVGSENFLTKKAATRKSSPKRRSPSTTSGSNSKKRKAAPSPFSESSNASLSLIDKFDPNAPSIVNRKTLRKQKVSSYPRDCNHFYNKVVKMKGEKLYHFCIEYDFDRDLLLCIPMQAKGELTGRREGRPRYQCLVDETDHNFKLASTSDCTIIRSAQVMKTPIIATEAWDIDVSNDANFVTRYR